MERQILEAIMEAGEEGVLSTHLHQHVRACLCVYVCVCV